MFLETQYYKDNLKADILSGLVVFLVALPLCLGIALASNAPIISGIISGIIAGLVVSLLSGSMLSVSGPAAGLTVIVASAIAKLGSFQTFLTAVFLSGVIQIILGLCRAGTLSAFFPNSVVRGMLAAIGITIILKQIPHGLGRDTDYEGDLNFWNVTDHENTLTELALAFKSISPTACLITVAGIFTLIYWPNLQKKMKALEFLPAALIVVILGVVINELMGAVAPSMMLMSDHLVSVPPIEGLSFFVQEFSLPGWSLLTNKDVLVVAVTIAIVGSIETLLCIEATDKLDPEGRISNTNRELLAQGTGNILCGLVGGLPMTSVIVRSSANVYSGAKTRMSCFFHGLFLFVCVWLLTPWLNRIPLATLAAILCVVGYKLTSPAIIQKVYSSGREQFIPFFVTVGTVILTDLLKGVLVGLVVAFILLIKTSIYGAVVVVREGKDHFIQFTKDVTFSNKAYLRDVLKTIPKDSKVYFDGTRAMFINYDIYEMINEFKERGVELGIEVEMIEMKGKNYRWVTRKGERVNAELS